MACAIIELASDRDVHLSIDLETPDWELILNTSDIVLPTPTASVVTSNLNNSPSYTAGSVGVTTQNSGWITWNNATFDLTVDTTDAIHAILIAALTTRTKLLFNITQSNTAADAYEFVGQVTDGTDAGTGDNYKRSFVLTPCHGVDVAATPAVPTP
jgi:hypothetical protein